MAVIGRFCFASSCRINHFGMNPVSGGKPPNDSSTRAVVVVRVGFFDQIIVRVLIFVVDDVFRVRNAADVMKMYVPRARRVSCGAYWRIIIIQPM